MQVKAKKYTRKKRQGVTLVIVITSLMMLLTAAGLVIDTGIVLNSQNELQKQAETAALFGATLFEPKKDGVGLTIKESDIRTSIEELINISKGSVFDYELYQSSTIDINPKSKAVRVKVVGLARPFFLNLMGIYTIKLNAQATAISMPFYLSKNFPKTPYVGSLMSTSSVEIDVRDPLGFNLNAGKDSGGVVLEDYLYGPPDNNAVPLGAGGYITMRLPTPIIDEEGADLYIKELGNMEGYFVFVGNDVNPDNPYIDEGQQGEGIEWTNISCTGTPEGGNSSSSVLGAYEVNVTHLNSSDTNEAKFYGSGYFDLGLSCSGSHYSAIDGTEKINSAKYLKIIDDNAEDGFTADNPVVPVALYGEHSSATPGVDIDAVGVLHHSRLIMSSDFDNDSDNDGLIDVLEGILGTDKSNSDTDSDAINDGLEYSGWYDKNAPKTIIDSASDYVYFTSPLVNESGMNRPLVFK